MRSVFLVAVELICSMSTAFHAVADSERPTSDPPEKSQDGNSGRFDFLDPDLGATTSAFMETFTDARSAGLKIPAGTYTIDPHIYTAASSISLIGDPNGKSVIRLSAVSGCNGGIFRWIGLRNILIQDITIDLSGTRAFSKFCSSLDFTRSSSIVVGRVNIVNAGPGGWLLISINGSSDGSVTDSYLSAAFPQKAQNQAINVSVAGGPVRNWKFLANTMRNTGNLLQGEELTFCKTRLPAGPMELE